MTIEAWLEGLGLGRYGPAFRAADIGLDVLPDLAEADLEALGVSLGDRKRLLRATAARGRRDIPALPVAPPARPQAERRRLTLLFADLAGSTALAERLDPEAMGELLKAFHAAVAAEIARHGGHLAKLMGDGALAYFGWPAAQEDEAERAVRAGLALSAAVGRLRTAAAEPLACRVGIATGLVVVGDLVGEGVAREEAVVGETPNLAARLQQLAGPGEVLVAEATRRLLGGLFLCRDLGSVEIKGFARPVPAWAILGEAAAESRFEARRGGRLTPLVGREEELALILGRWRQAGEGEGQVALLSGEPGVGKSRLVRAVRERLAAEPFIPLVHACSPFHRTSTLHPVIGLLERAAAIGREFRHDLLAAVAPFDGQTLDRALDRLVEAGLVFRHGTPPEVSYSFKHALVRDAAYESLLLSRRQQLHATIARTLEERFPAAAETAPELLAQHYAAAGSVEPAVGWWRRAGERALARSANLEAVAQARAGLELAARLPDTPQRWRTELGLQAVLAAGLVATVGNAAAETGAAYARARALCERLGDTVTLVPVLSGLSTFHQTRAQFAPMRAAADDLLRLGRAHADPAATVVGERSLGLCLFHQGTFDQARRRLGRVLALYDAEAHHVLKAIAAFDMRSAALTYAALSSLILGRPDEAARLGAEALDWTSRLEHPHTLAFVLHYAALFRVLRGGEPPAGEPIDELRGLARGQGFPVWLAGADIMHGRRLALAGRALEGVGRARRGWADRVATGTVFHETCFLGLLTDTYRLAGETEEARSRVEAALARVEATGERWFEAELHRRRGELLAAGTPAERAAARASLERALAVARGQGARWWELRAATALARLLAEAGEREGARELLAPTLAAIEGGHDTADRREAEALLAGLG